MRLKKKKKNKRIYIYDYIASILINYYSPHL